MKVLNGIAASDGISIGVCRVLDRAKQHVRRMSVRSIEVPHEINRLRFAVERTAEFINNSKQISNDSLSDDLSFIFEIYLMLLKDRMLIGETEKIISTEMINAEYALSIACRNLVKQFERSSNEYLKERKNDIENIVQKILRFMKSSGTDRLFMADKTDIVIAHDITPSDTAYMNRNEVKGFATDLGSRTSHTSILARSLGIPAVVGLGDVTSMVNDGDFIIIDGFEGIVFINPSDDVFASYRQKDIRYSDYVKELSSHKDEEAITTDGEKITLYSNIELNDEFYLSNEYKSGGVGLYRTEYIYMQYGDVDEDKQYEILKEAAELNGDKPLTIRTFDLGAEKLSKHMPHPDEQNPALGLRAVRYSLLHKDFFLKQIRAVLRVSAFADVRIMFPMISGTKEFSDCLSVVEEAKKQLLNEGKSFNDKVKTGVMIEVPSLAVISDIIAKKADFFSIGTNDLIQYCIGIDRNNEYVAYLYSPCHPAVIRLLRNVAESAAKEGIECAVCGEMAGDPKYIPLLLGLGYRTLSMSPASILKARMTVNTLSVCECEELVMGLCAYETYFEAEKAVESFIVTKCPAVFFH